MLQFRPGFDSSMDSLRHHQSNCNPLSSGTLYSCNLRRGSTSQICLHKILSIIATVPPPLAAAVPTYTGSETRESSAKKVSGHGFDLNVGFCVSSEPKETFESGLSSSSSTNLEDGVTAVGVGECFNTNRENSGDRVEREEHGNGVSYNSHFIIGEAEKSLTLLIEAARLIFGDFMDDDKSECGERHVSQCSELRKDEMAEDIHPIERNLRTAAEKGGAFEGPPPSPVVRTKRGRTQVLPCKYRDSVLEPLTRFSRTRSTFLPWKRRRR